MLDGIWLGVVTQGGVNSARIIPNIRQDNNVEYEVYLADAEAVILQCSIVYLRYQLCVDNLLLTESIMRCVSC
jgi:hypothetical protein